MSDESNNEASGVHSCSIHCQQPMCVLRRELARVTVENKDQRRLRWVALDRVRAANSEIHALRASVAELETEVKNLSALDDKNNEIALNVMRERDYAKQRNAELVATLKETRGYFDKSCLLRQHIDAAIAHAESATPATLEEQREAAALGFTEDREPAKHPDTGRSDDELRRVLLTCDGKGTKAKELALGELLRRAADSAPAKHPDTERLDWLEHQTASESRTGISFDYCRHVEEGRVVEMGFRFMKHHFLGDRTSSLRSAIDAARKQGGAS